MQDIEQALRFVVDEQVPAGEHALGPGILDHRQIGGEQQYRRTRGTHDCFENQPEEFGHGAFPLA